MSKPVRLAREARAELHEAGRRRYGEPRPELRIDYLHGAFGPHLAESADVPQAGCRLG